MPSLRHMIAATAGHIDHGKTALVRALTGTDTDRLEEEKRRGITIELGFAFLNDHVTIIDVPGHERFIKTMAAGVSTVDLALLVVAADDGVMPQTREHLAIVHLLGVPRLWVVLTKISGTAPEWLDLIEEELRSLLPDEYRSAARWFRCDSLSGAGIDALREALQQQALQMPPRRDSGVFRMPVDRAFSLKGHGTVVTGTILGGQISVGDQLEIMPAQRATRIRALQTHGEDQPTLSAGQRAAINLLGVQTDQVQRGDWMTAPGAFQSTNLLDVRLRVLPDSPPVRHRERVHLHLGTREVLARLHLLDGSNAVTAGAGAFAQIVTESPVIAARGDRFIVRRYSPLQTLGGGVVLDPIPFKRRRRVRDELAALEQVPDHQALQEKVRQSGTLGLQLDLARNFAHLPQADFDRLIERLETQGALRRFGKANQGFLLSSDVMEVIRRQIAALLVDHHRRFPEQLGIVRAELPALLAAEFPAVAVESALDELLRNELVVDQGVIRLREHRIQMGEETARNADRLAALLRESRFNPPPPPALAKQLAIPENEVLRLLNLLSQQGRILRLQDGSYWSAQIVEEAWATVRETLADGSGKTTSELRQALGCSRRQAVALLEHFDSTGRTHRWEERRFLGANFAADQLAGEREKS